MANFFPLLRQNLSGQHSVNYEDFHSGYRNRYHSHNGWAPGIISFKPFHCSSPASGSFLHLNVNQYSAEDSRGKSLQSLEFFLFEAPVLFLVDNGHPGLLSFLAQGDKWDLLSFPLPELWPGNSPWVSWDNHRTHFTCFPPSVFVLCYLCIISWGRHFIYFIWFYSWFGWEDKSGSCYSILAGKQNSSALWTFTSNVFAHNILSSRLSSWWTPFHHPQDRSTITFSVEPNPNIQERITVPSSVLLGAFLYHVSTMRCIRLYPNCLVRCLTAFWDEKGNGFHWFDPAWIPTNQTHGRVEVTMMKRYVLLRNSKPREGPCF